MPGESVIFQIDDVPFRDVEWGLSKVLVGLDTGDERRLDHTFELKITEYGPGFSHLGHTHPGQIEVIYPLSGRGVHEREDGSKTPFGVGDVLYIPQGVYHANHNANADEPLRVIVIKVPPTPAGG